MKYKSDQEGFWAEDYSKEYIKKNSQFDGKNTNKCANVEGKCWRVEITRHLRTFFKNGWRSFSAS